MARFEIWLKTDLGKPMQVKALPGSLFTQDSRGHLVGVEVFDHGAAAALAGTVTGYILRADGVTVSVSGVLEGNRAYILLPPAAYAAAGQVQILIRLTEDGENGAITVLAACTTVVQRSRTEALADPEHVIPSLEQLLAQVSRMEAATDAAAEAIASADAAAERLEGLTVSAETLTPGSPAAAQVGVTEGHYHIALGLPRGETGEAAIITAVGTAYQQSDNGQTPPGGAWQESPMEPTPGRYLWTRTVLTWNSGQTTTLYTVARQGMDGQGAVSTVNGVSPDGSGNVQLPVDDAPVSGSAHLISSGAVAEAMRAIGARVITVDFGTVSSLPVTRSAAGITADMRAIAWEIGSPAAFIGDLTVTAAEGAVTLSGSVFAGAGSAVKITLCGNTDVTGT